MKTHLLASLILVSSSALACNQRPTDHYSLLIDPAFSSDQDQMIIDATNAWETATNHQVIFDAISVADCKFKKEENQTCIYSSDVATIDAKLGEDNAIGFTEWFEGNNSAEIFLDTAYLVSASPALGEQLILHEMGHSFRLKHTAPGVVPWSVMCPNQGCATTTIQCSDVVQYEQLRNGFASCQ
jgi:hypothetical protein